MHTVKCPNCGANVTFRAGEAVFAVCSYCQTTLVREDVTVESIGKMAILQNAWSPLQLFTEGDFDGGHFFIVGQVTYRYDRGTWTEWYVTFNDGRSGWMTEAQGFYALSVPAETSVPSLSQLSPGVTVTLRGRAFTVQDIKSATVAWAEGELPFKALPGRASTCVDLSGDNNTFASLEYCEDKSQVFIGAYREFEALNLQNLRAIDGW